MGCKACKLYKNQAPLLDDRKKGDVFWIGLSAVRIDEGQWQRPLAPDTRSGGLIDLIERQHPQIAFYKTNLVKCLPESNGKLRYPSQDEMKSCFGNLHLEFKKFSPRLAFALGGLVSGFIERMATDSYKPNEYRSRSEKQRFFWLNNTKVHAVEHPSYILIYKRKRLDTYIKNISTIINQHFV
jgi:DNA polymerase